MFMRKRYLVSLALLSGLLAAAEAGYAQNGTPGQVELGVFGVYSRYDRAATGFSPNAGAGGRLALYVSRLISLETSGDYTVTDLTGGLSELGITRLGATLLFHTRALGFYMGPGYERSYYRGPFTAVDAGGHVMLGTRLSMGGRAALRVEGRASYLPKAGTASDRPLHLAGQVGLSVFAFGGPPRDADGDKVANRRDQCPDTPRGARVDPQGCPTDGDKDQVFDGLDACDGTPSGALVDERGCPKDTDRDTVFDGIDLCADTPEGATVDPNGCPTDADRDSVFDGIDRCAETPAGATVDAFGCPGDQDADKVLNGLDQCPDTPAGTEVDARGCTVQRDSDSDGVFDQQDRCPNTAPGTKVDAVGCPELQQVVQAQPAPLPEVVQAQARNIFEFVEGRAQPLVLKGVNFRTGRSDLTPESYAILDEVASSLVANPAVRIEIGGHTDATGARARNQALSLARAMSVRAYLASKSVTPDRMQARGYGPDRPVADNRTVEGRAMNRRVELNLQGQAPPR